MASPPPVSVIVRKLSWSKLPASFCRARKLSSVVSRPVFMSWLLSQDLALSPVQPADLGKIRVWTCVPLVHLPPLYLPLGQPTTALIVGEVFLPPHRMRRSRYSALSRPVSLALRPKCRLRLSPCSSIQPVPSLQG